MIRTITQCEKAYSLKMKSVGYNLYPVRNITPMLAEARAGRGVHNRLIVVTIRSPLF